jgi:tRNA-specific 2-thiouridylase
MRVVVAMSGGVDSSVAAALLAESGHDVTGAYLRSGVEPGSRAARGKQGCCGAADALDAARVADLIGIPFYSLDFADGFDALVDEFAATYAAGRTPNPCIACNRDLKFGRLLRFADAVGADAVATGHYARVERHAGRIALRAARDARKDQSYVLFPLSQDHLGRSLFPLGELSKDEVRAAAAVRALPVSDKPESMEICFVPDGDYRAVVRERAPAAFAPGEYVDGATGDVVGRHAGVASVTVGQRRGLGVTGPEPRYVTGIDVARNRVRLGRAADLLRRDVLVDGWNAVAAPPPVAGDALRGRARIRRNHAGAPATVVAESGSVDARRVGVRFDDPVRAPAPGQALVLYDDDGRVLGGGWIAPSETAGA